MKLIKRENDKMVEIGNVESIVGLENHQIVMLERSDKNLKKIMNKANRVGGQANCYSVKAIRQYVSEAEAKLRKKHNKQGGLCCVCSDWSNNLDEHGIGDCCQLISKNISI